MQKIYITVNRWQGEMANMVRVLVIEDEPRSVDLFEEFLSKEGLNRFIITKASTLSQGLFELHQKKFDVILLDLVLPNGRGIEVFNKVFLLARNTPIVVTAVDEDKNTALEAVRSGAQDYLIKKNLTDQLLRRSLRYAIERKKLEICKIEKERRLKRIVESTKAAIYELDFINDKFTYVNNVCCEQTGYSKEEFLSMHVADILTPDSIEKWLKRFQDLAEGKEVQASTEYEIIKKDGSTSWVLISAEYIRDEQNKITGANVVALDITPQRKAQEEAKRYQERLTLAMQATTDGIWDWNDGDCYYSPRWEQLLGYEPGTVERTLAGFLELLHPDDVVFMKENIEKYMVSGSVETDDYNAEFRMFCADGSYKWILSKGKVIERYEDGSPKRVIGTHTDIDTQKREELAIDKELEKHIEVWSEQNKVFKEQQEKKMDRAISEFCDVHKQLGVCKYGE
jgi:PAS domain S-box-containing protein